MLNQTYHAIGNAVTDNLVDDIPGCYRCTQTLDLLLNMLWNNVGDEITGGDTPWKPRLYIN